MGARAVLRADDLWAGYSGTQVLRGIDLEVRAGDAPVGIVGPSGAGKTTLVRALQGALRPTGGSVTFNDRPVHRLPRRESKQFKAAVRFTSQDSLTVTDLRLTVARSLALALGEARKAGRTHGTSMNDLLDAVGLPPAFAGRRMVTLSGGEKQRVALAAALATRPEILVLDEPLTAVDPQARADLTRRLAPMIAELDTAVVLVSHDLELVQRTCRHVHFLAEGTVVATGPLANLLAGEEQHPTVRAIAQAAPLAVQRFR
ncbi:ABC transporter ATP-binding protein [uncultured Georgenia sp.]|uniref:ABC transporter ATP-binding protein n=1 Tax=uncultured Georgenia sp. TaxID=378209 RepID=UPI0026116208|nr:ABC transporter ATP-binding protein [uncultured Georgenia sp.]HLV05574.1 ABC transporter ATP-binding protein [Actinomycetaceae bacterium]